MAVENAQGEIVSVATHESHEEAVVAEVVGAHDYQVEEVPHARVLHVLDDELADKVVGVVAVAVEEGGEEAQKLAILKHTDFIS